MPRNKDLKRLVRARMSKTGESYTAARVHVLAKSTSKPRTTALRAAESRKSSVVRAPRPNYAALAGYSDEVLKAGVNALDESRFVYKPPAPTFGTSLARLYVSRRKWGPAVLAIALMLIIGLGGYFLAWRPYQQAQVEAARVELTEGLPRQMDALYQTIFEETKVQQAVGDADAIRSRGKAAATEGNRAGAEQAIGSLTALRDRLRQEYTVRIVNREGQKTGFWTFPEINTAATNYYVVVEAVDPQGNALTLPVTNEENGQTENVSIWGVRVPEATYRAVEADKRDDGIVQRSTLGLKEFGFLDVDWAMPVLGGAVTRW